MAAWCHVAEASSLWATQATADREVVAATGWPADRPGPEVTEPEVAEPEWFLAEATGTGLAWPGSTGYAAQTAHQASGSGDAGRGGCERGKGGDVWMTSAYGRPASNAMTRGYASAEGATGVGHG
jgi:hypothetical protein